MTAETTASEPIHRSEAFVRGILDSLPQEVAVLDEAGVLIAVNEPWERFARQNGGAPDVLSVGANYLEVCRNSAREGDVHAREGLEGLESLLAGERSNFMVEYPCDSPACSRWFVLHASRPAFGHGSIILSHTDITPQKKAEETLRDADRRKDEFLAILAHELRNPLVPISDALHVLRRSDSNDPEAKERDRKLLTILGRQVNHLVRLVDDLWEISRIGYGKIELKKERIDLCVTLRDAVDISRPFIEAGSHRLTVDSPSEPLLLDGDAVRLTQVFANLLNNAAKYTPPEGHIEILTKRDGDDAIICVRDTGMGIRAGMLPRVFDLFTQSSRALSHSHGGIGVGLALARSLIEMHGGQVEGHSEGVGRGSEFVVRLPLTGAMPENG